MAGPEEPPAYWFEAVSKHGINDLAGLRFVARRSPTCCIETPLVHLEEQPFTIVGNVG